MTTEFEANAVQAFWSSTKSGKTAGDALEDTRKFLATLRGRYVDLKDVIPLVNTRKSTITVEVVGIPSGYAHSLGLTRSGDPVREDSARDKIFDLLAELGLHADSIKVNYSE